MKRVSIKSFLIGFTIFALFAGLCYSQYQISVMHQELILARKELGVLVPEDWSKVNIMPVPTGRSGEFQWRIYAPEGTRFEFGIEAGSVNKKELKGHVFSNVVIPSRPNGVLLKATVSKQEDGGYRLALEIGGGDVLEKVYQLEKGKLFGNKNDHSERSVTGHRVLSFAEPFVLYERRNSELGQNGQSMVPENNATGFRFWLKPF